MKIADEFYGGPEGFILFWVAVLTVVGMACIFTFVIYRMFQDAFRFGRERLFFPCIIFVCALFSGFGFWLWGGQVCSLAWSCSRYTDLAVGMRKDTGKRWPNNEDVHEPPPINAHCRAAFFWTPDLLLVLTLGGIR